MGHEGVAEPAPLLEREGRGRYRRVAEEGGEVEEPVVRERETAFGGSPASGSLARNSRRRAESEGSGGSGLIDDIR